MTAPSTAPSLAQTGAETDHAALPGDLYGTRDAIFHLLRGEETPQTDEDRAPAPQFSPQSETRKAAPVIAVAKYRPKAKTPQKSEALEATPAEIETNTVEFEPAPAASTEPGQKLNKARFREKQHVAEGTSARFTPKAANAPLVLAATKRAKPVKKRSKTVMDQKPLSPAAMAVLRGYLQVVANTDGPAMQTTDAPQSALTGETETMHAAPEPLPTRRAPLPLPRPVASKEALAQVFNEDHFEFQSASKAAALRERMVERRMQAAS